MLVLCSAAVLVLVLTATAVPSEYTRDIFGLIHGDTNSSTRLNTMTLITSTSAKHPTSTSQSVPSQWTPTPASQPNSTVSATINTTATSIPSVVPASAEGQPTDHSSKTWQIIGVAIISVLFIAMSITCAMFFDRLWRFLRDVVCCTSHPVASEEFLPHSETQSWDTKSLPSSPPGFSSYKSEEGPSAYTRELPWNTGNQDWATLHRQPSRRNDHPSAA